MPKMLSGQVLSWAADLDDQTRNQAEDTADLPFVQGHLALMPDAHYGPGSTVGSVIPTRGAIIPSAIGVDIGCGMIAGLTNLMSGDLPDTLDPLHAEIAKRVPSGVGAGHLIPKAHKIEARASWIGELWTDSLNARADRQLGSLGSGNHFVEVCVDEIDRVWVVLHSGSRGVGYQLAQYHIDKAKGLMAQYFIELPHPDLAYLVEDTREFSDYIDDMTWAQEYAALNRSTMLAGVIEAMHAVQLPVGLLDTINCHHNYTALENHNGRNVWLTRKGAIRARLGDRGVIPGSMGTSSYIVRGLGNSSSYHSCAHGAGRRMGRKEARRKLTADSLSAAMEGKTWNQEPKALLDEHPDAYKRIEDVMEAQSDLVRIEHTLNQVLNYKGT